MARDGQKQIGLFLNLEFLEEIDAALEGMGYTDRSTFIRDAVYEELKRKGVKLPEAIKNAPSRSGKGGKPTHKKKRGGVPLKLSNGISMKVAEDQKEIQARIMIEGEKVGGVPGEIEEVDLSGEVEEDLRKG